MAQRSSVFLNTGRWPEAVGAALPLQRTGSAGDLVAALALFEVGRRREALVSFLHGALNGPRAARLLLGLRDRAVHSRDEAVDHNTGVELHRDLHAYLRDHRRASLRFFAGIAARPDVAALLKEVEAVVQRWREERRSGAREAFDRMTAMRSIAFAREHGRRIANDLALDPDLPVVPVAVVRGRRGKSDRPGQAVH